MQRISAHVWSTGAIFDRFFVNFILKVELLSLSLCLGYIVNGMPTVYNVTAPVTFIPSTSMCSIKTPSAREILLVVMGNGAFKVS